MVSIISTGARFGVTLFFLISGYVIPLSFSGPTPKTKFVISRIFRLYPAFWLAVLVMASALVIDGATVPLTQVLANITMAYPAFRQPALSGVYWTLIIELGFYIIAFGLFTIRRLECPKTILALAILAMLSGIGPVVANAYGASLPVNLLGYHLSFLLLGSLIRQARENPHHARTAAIALAIAIAVTLPIVCWYRPGEQEGYSMATPGGAMASVIAAVAVFLLSWRKGAGRPAVPLLALGAWSYSIYLFHEPLAVIAKWFIYPANWAASALFLAVVIGGTIALAAAVYRFIEAPAINLGRTLIKGRAPTAAVEVAP